MVYDEEWSDAYEEIQSLLKLCDAEVYEVLLNIVIVSIFVLINISYKFDV